MRRSDEQIERLGTYFVSLNIFEKYGITFDRFVQLVEANTWKEYVA